VNSPSILRLSAYLFALRCSKCGRIDYGETESELTGHRCIEPRPSAGRHPDVAFNDLIARAVNVDFFPDPSMWN
jgi:hypothetical protein